LRSAATISARRATSWSVPGMATMESSETILQIGAIPLRHSGRAR
jgi:hypothetical protein